MKKILVIALAVFAMTACNKDYTCGCTTTSTTPAGTTTSSQSHSTGKMSEDDAIDACDEGDAEASSGGYSTIVECEIK